MNTNMTLEKRILSVLLTVIMVFSMVPLSVFAADGNQASVTVNKTETEYATIQEAFDAAKKLTEPCTVKVLQSFKGSMVLGVTFTAEDNCDITLDVNGFDMYNRNTRDQASASMFTFEKGTNAHLTVVNTAENRETYGGIFYYPNGTDISNSVFHMEGGTLTIEDVGGDGIKNKTSNYDKISGSILYLDGGNVTINGSKFGEENSIVPLYVKSGNLTVNGGTFITQQGNALRIAEGFAGKVNLSGGKFSSTFTSSKMDEKGNFVQVYSIPSILREDGGKVDDLLAKGYVYQKNADDEKNSESALYREISVVPEPGVKYIAADGTEQSCTEYTELTESTNGSAGLTGWYVVKGTVNKEGLIGIAGGKTLNLILCEGATLNLQQTLYLMGGATLNIYGQNGGTGTLIVKGTAGVRQPGIGIMHNTVGGSASVNIYGGTVTAQTDNGAQPIGTNPELMPYGKVTVTIAKGLKCVKTDDQNTAYAYDNTDGTSITITKCTEHKWSYTNITNDTHDRTCDLCGTAETGVAHTTARYQYIRADIHRLICACGKGYSTEYHTYTYAPNSDGLTHTATCKCEYSVDDIAHTYKGEDEICICGAVHSATYDGKKYASLQSAIDAAAPVGGTVTLARQVNENVVSTDGTVTIDLGRNIWSGYIDDWGSIVPLTVNGGSVTLKNGNLFQWWSSSSARTGIEINDGSVTIEEDVRVMGGIPEGDVLSPSITLNGGTLILKEGAVLLSGLQVPEGKVLADYLPEGTAFVKCSYDNSSDTVTVSDPQEFVSDVYSTNRSTEGMMIVSHTHDFGGGTACPCGFNCDHSVVDSATGKCENCGTQIYVASLVKADGTAENYDIFANAWTAAIESEGSTLKLLCNVEFEDNGADGLVLDHGKFTLDLGGFTLESFAYQQMLVISGTADIVIKNGVLLNTYNTEGGGQLFLSTGNAIDVKGGSLTLDGVTLHGAYEVKGALPDGEIQSYALELYSGNLTVENCTFFGSLAVYKMSDDSSLTVKIISADLRNGLIFTAMGEEKDYDGFSKFFADGSMLFDENGKYIDVRDDNYWITEGGEEYGFYATGFYYENSAIVKRHTHTYENGKCAECGYACPHDSGINDREAGYFEKAICSVCHAEYGNYAKDTNKPTGRIEIKERTWWESFIHAITFGLFYKEKVTVEITASDDSYSQAGYDETKHAVKIEYLISNTELSLETVKNSAFTEYKGEIDISDDSRYVVYARLNDFAGNEEYISTDGFVIDTTPPVIEVDADGQSKRYSNGQRAEVCGDTQINFIDDNFDTAYRTIDGEKDKIWSSPFLVAASDTDRTERWITFEVHDKAGNISTVEVYVHKEHSFDEETGVCAYCGYQAAVLIKCSNDNNEEEFVSGDGLDETMRKVDENKFDRFYLKLYGNVEKKAGVGTYGSTSKKWTFDLNGYTISNPPSVDPNPVAALFYVAGDITFVGNGGMNADVVVDGGQLTIDGECSFQKLEHKRGTLTVNAGSFESLIISKLDVNWSYTRETALCGGHYGEIKIVDIEGLTCADLLARGYRFEGLTLEQAKVTELKDATIVACDHADIGSDGICPDCGMEFFLSVEANGTTKLFETFESAIRYAEQNDGSTVKLLQDITLCRENVGSLISNYYIYLKTGTYTLDLAGKALTIGDGAESLQGLSVTGGCNLTVTDTVGDGKIKSSRWGEIFEVRSGSHLTIERGDYTDLSKVSADGPDSLTIKGGKFNCVASKEGSDSVSPLTYLADGCAFMLSSGEYASEKDVESQYISGRGTTYWIKGVTVVSAPLIFHSQPRNKVYYLTTPNYEKWASFAVEYSGGYPPKGDITVTGEKTDGTVVYTNTVKPTRIFEDAINLWEFTTADSGQYRIKLEYNGYVLYSNTFTITMAVCEHPGYDEYNKCSQCGCDLAAAIVKDGKTSGYVTFADALAAAQTDANKGCTLKLLADVNEKVAVKAGEFTLDATDCKINGALNVAKGADLTVGGGEITGNVICAKGGKLTAFGTHFAGTINCVGEGDLRNCKLAGAVTGKSSLKLNSCEIPGNLSISGNAEAEKCTVRGTVTVNNGGSLKSTGGTYKNTVNVKSGGTLEIVSGTFDKKLTAESGSKLIVSGGSYAEVGAENNVDFTLSGGEFTNITVNGQHLIDCLAEGKAFEDMNNSFIIDGRVGIAGDVKVVDHTHTCIWKTSTHEKLCGCGYVEAVDTEAPVISGIDPENNHYGSLEFTVTDANDFTVWMDDEEITLVNGKYTMEPDNETHLITATDIAGNTVSFRFGIFKTYHVTLPTGVGYIIHSRESTVRHGDSYDFIVEFNNGYSRTEDFKVLVNGNKLDELSSDRDSASFVVRDVSEDLVITVEGVADITAPEVEVSIRGNSFKEFLNRITFGLFFKQTQTVEVKAHDFGSGIKKVEYLLSETAFADKDAITGSWTELDLNDAFKAYFSIEPSQKTFVYVRVTDMSDNITVVNTDGMVVYTDAEAVTGAQTFTKTTDSDVVYKLNLNGNFVAKVYNGTEEIGAGSDYALLANGMLMLKNSYLRTLAAGEYTIRLTIKPMGENYADNSGNDAPADVVMKLTVEKKAPTLDHTPSDGKIYDGKPIGKPTLNTDSDGALTFEYKRADEEDTAYTTEAPKNVGKYTISITTAETDTFKAASSTMEFEIQPKEVTISDVKVADKTYDGTTNATITNAGTLSVNYDGDNLAIVIGKAAYDNKNVGTDKAVSFAGFELSGSAAGNYKLITQPADTTADITAKEITINGATVEGSKVYDGTVEAKITNAGTLSDNYDGENLTIVTGSAAYDNKNVGTGKTVAFTGFALAGDAAGNYTLASQPADTAADITVKEITINGAAVEASRIYDGTTDAKITNAGAPSVNYDGENLKVAAGKAAYDNKNVGKGKAVMFTGFALEGDAAANYKLTAQPDAVTADITVKEIKIVDTAVETSKIYDGSPDAKITEKGTFDGLINGDKVDIVTGKAAYDDKNVGNGKTVAFYDFALSGDDAANYVLAAQPANTTASISAKELTIADLKVKDKQYDGKNTAAIDGTPALVGVVDGDMLTLINGVPTFDSVKIGKDIAISFTAFTLSGDSVTVGNYTLTQPSGITANIVEYVATGDEYSVNSNDWINKDFVITAKAGYALSLTDTANGEWSNTLSAAGETGKGRLTFYVKNTATGVISAAVTENYKIDKTAPTGEVKLNERTAFQKFINTITFGLFFKDDVNVKLTAKDEASGVKSVMYFKSDRILTDEEVRAITDWTDNSDFDIEAKDMDKFVIYVRIEDNAGNVTLIGSDGATFDTTAPEIVGVENDKTYYVTKKIAIDDENLASVTLNGETVEDVFTLVGDKDATYVIRTEDKAGNVTEYTVYMKPISSITDAISAITADNVKSSDAETISSVERQILDIAEAFDDGESTEDEWNKLTAAAAKCKDLNKRIAEVADEITRLTDAVNGYDIDKVTSDDKADVEKLIADIDTLLDGDNLTDTERAALEALKGTARALLDRIAAAKDAAEADEITVIDGITKDNVKLGDKEALETAEKALEGALRDFEGNYTDEEQEDLETRLETVKAALAAIGNAEKAAEEIGKLPSADDAKLSDKSDLDRVKKLLEGLTENEKAMLDKDALGKVDALAEKIQKLAEEANSPKTGDTSNLALWIALLFISGGAVIGTAVVSKKQKHSAK